MKENHDEYDDECIIQDVTDEKILWISKGGNEQKLHRNSFDPVLSKTKKKLSLTTNILTVRGRI